MRRVLLLALLAATAASAQESPFDLVRARTVYAAGRPTWMALAGTRTLLPITLPRECAGRVCIAEARRADEPDSTSLDCVVPEGVVHIPTDRAAVVTFLDGRTGAPVGPTVHSPDVLR